MRTLSRLGTLLLVACVVATACGDSSTGSDVPVTDVPVTDVPVTDVPVTDVPVIAAPVTAAPDTAVPGVDDSIDTQATADDSVVRRELGLVLRPESDVATNPLPPVEVHDVGQGRMVNFKNIFPADQPVLLWMWAPF